MTGRGITRKMDKYGDELQPDRSSQSKPFFIFFFLLFVSVYFYQNYVQTIFNSPCFFSFF